MQFQPENKIIFVAKPEQLLCRWCFLHLWTIAVTLTHLSSGKWITAIEELFRDASAMGIEFRYPDGRLWEIPFIWEIFPDEGESGRRWFSNFRRCNKSGTKPRYRSRSILRLQCVELFLQANVAKYRRGTETPRCACTHVPLGW